MRTCSACASPWLPVRLGFVVSMHVFGCGPSIARRGAIVVNLSARRREPPAPHLNQHRLLIGANVCVEPGAVLYGPITIADNIAIDANSVVTTSFTEPNITIAGAPARKVRDGGTARFVRPARAPPVSPGIGAAVPPPPSAPIGPLPEAPGPSACADAAGIH